MTAIKEYLNHLDSLTHLSNIEKLRYAYMDLGKRFQFNTKVLIDTNITKKNEFYSRSDSEEAIQTVFNSNKIICKQTATIMQIIGKHLGFNIKIIRHPLDLSPNSYHVLNAITNEDGTIWTIDLQKDLYFIQNHVRTTHFGKILTDKSYTDEYFIQEYMFNPSKLKEMDERIGYLKDEYYNDDYYEMMNQDIAYLNDLEEKLEFILYNIEPSDNEIGEQERYFFHNLYVRRLLSFKNMDRVEEITCYKKEHKNKIYFPAFVLFETGERTSVKSIYLYHPELKEYQKMTPEEFMLKTNTGEIITLDSVKKIIKKTANKTKKRVV